MLTSKQYQEAFNLALEAFKSDPRVRLSEGRNPYSPGSDEYRAWNDGWLYASNDRVPASGVAGFHSHR